VCFGQLCQWTVGYRSKRNSKRETVGDCLERKNRPRSTHQDISMSLLESVTMCIARLEIHFPKIGAESILEYITLAGGLLPGHRRLPFVRNTITFVLSEIRGQNVQTYLLTNTLVSLFFSDAPDHVIGLLEGEAAWFLKSYLFRSLLAILAWNRSAVAPSNGFSAAPSSIGFLYDPTYRRLATAQTTAGP
jgi:hypothetical protein